MDPSRAYGTGRSRGLDRRHVDAGPDADSAGASHMRAAGGRRAPTQKRRAPDTKTAGPRRRERRAPTRVRERRVAQRECWAPTQRARQRRALTQRKPGRDTESVGRAPGPHTESAGLTKRAREHRAPTQRALGANTESAGARHRAPGHDMDLQVWPVKEITLDLRSLRVKLHIYIYIYIYEQVERDPDSVRQWLLPSWSSVCFSQRLFLKACMHQ